MERAAKTAFVPPKPGEQFIPYALRFKIWRKISAIVRSSRLHGFSKLAYEALAFCAGQDGECYPSKAALGEYLGGLTERTVQRAVGQLVSAGLISKEQGRTKTGRPGANNFVFLWHKAFNGVSESKLNIKLWGDKIVSPPPWTAGETDQTPLGETSLSGEGRQVCPKQGRPASLPNQEKESNQESSSTERSKNQARQQSTRVGVAADTDERRAAEQIESPNADDDEPTDPKLALEFRIARRHPSADVDYIMRHVQQHADKAGLTLAQVLAYDTIATTGPDSIRDPKGYYPGLADRLAKEDQRKARDAVVNARLVTDRILLEMRTQGKRLVPVQCAHGCKDGRMEAGGYCSCETGEVAKQVDQRLEQRAKTEVA